MSELSQAARDLIDGAAHADDPSDSDRGRVRRRLAAKLGAAAMASGLGAGSSSAVSASAGGMSTGSGSLSMGAGASGLKIGTATGLLKFVLATGLAGAIGGAWLTSKQPALVEPARQSRIEVVSDALPVEVESVGVQTVPIGQPVVEPLLLPSLAPTVEPVAADPAWVASDPLPQRSSPASKAGKQKHGKGLALELKLLASAQAALRSGDAEQALKLVLEHGARFPRGVLREERYGIEALARCTLGEDGASVVAELTRHSPASPLLSRVRAACGSE